MIFFLQQNFVYNGHSRTIVRVSRHEQESLDKQFTAAATKIDKPQSNDQII